MSAAWPGNTFNISFPGGRPKQLVEAIEAASQTSLNAIIPEEHKDMSIPPLKLRDVTVPQLFEALSRATSKTVTRRTGPGSTSTGTVSYGFRTTDERPTTNSIWYFYAPEPAMPPEAACRFWNLEPYLQGMRIEDITTAIETGWKMLAVDPLPKLSFHKDTKLLIVVGQPGQLSMIDDVLRELTPRSDPATGSPAKQSAQGPGERPSKR